MSRKMTVGSLVHELSVVTRVVGRDDKIRVQFSGKGAYISPDGTVNLPAMPFDKELTNHDVQFIRGASGHEGGHARFTDLKRVFPWYKHLAETNRDILKHIHNCIEDVWMESKVIARYPGDFKNLRAVEEQLKKEGLEEVPEDHDWSAFSPMNVINIIKPNTPMFNVEGSYHRELFMKYSPELRAHCDSWIKETMKAESSEDCIRIAKAIYKMLIEDSFEESKPEDFEPVPEGSGEFEEGDPMSDEEREAGLAQSVSTGEGKETEEGEAGTVKVLGGEPSDLIEGIAKELNEDTKDDRGCITSWTVPTTEQDRVYTRKGKYYHEIIKSNQHQVYEYHKAQLKGSISTMKNKLKRSLLSETEQRWTRNLDKGKLDPRKLSKVGLGKSNVFKKKDKLSEAEDTVITIMVDLSGSMMSRGRDTTARDCVIALSECLSGSGYTFRVMGYCNPRNFADGVNISGFARAEPLDTLVFKDFDDTLRSSRGAIGQLDECARGNNTDYEFIFNELEVLKAREESRKVLFVLSDGYPEHRGDIRSNIEADMCKDLLTKAKKDHKVQSVGIGIQTRSVKSIYPEHVSITEVNDLSKTVFNKLTDILIKGGK